MFFLCFYMSMFFDYCLECNCECIGNSGRKVRKDCILTACSGLRNMECDVKYMCMRFSILCLIDIYYCA